MGRWPVVAAQKMQGSVQKWKVFTIHAKLIALAVQGWGKDPHENPRLAEAIEKARKANVPNENIERAIKKWAGEDKDATQVSEIFYEGYGAGGVGVIVRVITDNKNRVAANIRHHFSHNGGNLGESGSVASFVFQHKGVITIAHTGSIEQLENDIIESGADDYKIEGEKVLVMTPRTELAHIGALLKNKGHSIEEMKLEYIPASTITIEDFDKAVKIYKLLHDLNEDEDVEDVWSNAHLTAEHMERAAKAIENAFVRK